MSPAISLNFSSLSFHILAYYFPLPFPMSHPSLPSPSSTPPPPLLPLPPRPLIPRPVLDGEQKDLRSQLQTAEQELYELRQTHSLEVDSSRARQEEMERKVGDVHTCMHICTCVCVCTYVDTYVSVGRRQGGIDWYVRMYIIRVVGSYVPCTLVHVRTYVMLGTYMHAYVRTCSNAYVCTYVCVCI